jgi:hypothetical protein
MTHASTLRPLEAGSWDGLLLTAANGAWDLHRIDYNFVYYENTRFQGRAVRQAHHQRRDFQHSTPALAALRHPAPAAKSTIIPALQIRL